jgi:hypothetical protein
LTWIIPGKLLAFASPLDSRLIRSGLPAVSPFELVPTLKKLGITHIVRLCEPTYDQQLFIAAGFTYTDLSFRIEPMPQDILDYFKRIITSDEIVAVHCKTGLSRTATIIGAHLIRDHHFSAAEAIAWLRLCRPGSVVGNDQRFLATYDQTVNCREELKVQIARKKGSSAPVRRESDRSEGAAARKAMSARNRSGSRSVGLSIENGGNTLVISQVSTKQNANANKANSHTSSEG